MLYQLYGTHRASGCIGGLGDARATGVNGTFVDSEELGVLEEAADITLFGLMTTSAQPARPYTYALMTCK